MLCPPAISIQTNTLRPLATRERGDQIGLRLEGNSDEGIEQRLARVRNILGIDSGPTPQAIDSLTVVRCRTAEGIIESLLARHFEEPMPSDDSPAADAWRRIDFALALQQEVRKLITERINVASEIRDIDQRVVTLADYREDKAEGTIVGEARSIALHIEYLIAKIDGLKKELLSMRSRLPEKPYTTPWVGTITTHLDNAKDVLLAPQCKNLLEDVLIRLWDLRGYEEIDDASIRFEIYKVIENIRLLKIIDVEPVFHEFRRAFPRRGLYSPEEVLEFLAGPIATQTTQGRRKRIKRQKRTIREELAIVDREIKHRLYLIFNEIAAGPAAENAKVVSDKVEADKIAREAKIQTYIRIYMYKRLGIRKRMEEYILGLDEEALLDFADVADEVLDFVLKRVHVHHCLYRSFTDKKLRRKAAEEKVKMFESMLVPEKGGRPAFFMKMFTRGESIFLDFLKRKDKIELYLRYSEKRGELEAAYLSLERAFGISIERVERISVVARNISSTIKRPRKEVDLVLETYLWRVARGVYGTNNPATGKIRPVHELNVTGLISSAA